jgi:hypothetical protein
MRMSSLIASSSVSSFGSSICLPSCCILRQLKWCKGNVYYTLLVDLILCLSNLSIYFDWVVFNGRK